MLFIFKYSIIVTVGYITISVTEVELKLNSKNYKETGYKVDWRKFHEG